MASVTIDSEGRSPYWICCYTTSAGRRLKKSTKVRRQPLKGELNSKGGQKTAGEARAEAEEICRSIEHAERLAGTGDATESQFRKILHDTLQRVGRGTLRMPTSREWLGEWVEGRKGSASDRTLLKYQQVTKGFLDFLGARSNAKFQTVTQGDIIQFRANLLAEGRTPQTADSLVRKILNIPFSLALRTGIIQVNPVAGLVALRGDKVSKAIFTPEQVGKLVKTADGDWKGLILSGYYTGARLLDLARLTWKQVDLAAKTLTIRQSKTGAIVVTAMHPALEEYFLSLPSADTPEANVFPTLAPQAGTGRSGLSMQFKEIMKKAGIAAGVARAKSGKKGRDLSALSFHSLRHSFNSALANAGVSQELRQKLTGHATVAANNTYTHHELEVIREAVNLIPKIEK